MFNSSSYGLVLINTSRAQSRIYNWGGGGEPNKLYLECREGEGAFCF